MKLPIIEDWRKAWRFLTIQATVLLAVLSGIQADMLPFVQPIFPPKYWPWVTAGFGVAIGILRIVAQPKLDAAAPSNGAQP